MATKAERARTEEQHESAARKRAAEKTQKPRKPAKRAGSVASKATYAYEAPRAEKPSRRSTRKSANRVKSSAGVERREMLAGRSPEARARRAKAKTVRSRGS